MGRRLRRFRPSPALVISVIALFVAIGGVSWAATKIGTNDIKRGAVTTKKLHKFAVTKTKLHGNSVKSGKVIDDSLTGADINESTLGQVPDADTVDGFNADAFLQSNVYKNESAVTQGTQLDATGTFYIDEACDAGDQLLSGGPANVNSDSDMVESFPTPGSTNSWRARIDPVGVDNFSVVVLCANQP